MSHIVPGPAGPESADPLDHAREFVEFVLRHAPDVYRELLEAPAIRQRLANDRPFNHGKLYAWAEFVVFRSEFLQRFPEASQAACINAFSRLLLKNDISMTNLAALMEATTGDELARLARLDES